ncbi:calcineurin-like phosphoesterase family protein [Sinomicrobium kalidii]|uniref:calcineurin-like phosphoesterase C-terminal domain-containing protein n=1 Tax=Sinomicrobium kalidii TaxID=2900738 RepID=UPI001E620145|nr:calcineurin-like phosphoesterase family protein [Sinomicrobium kalidii]UGU15446.1 calcineurin-like phosphoesterase family protein [Sinomicrobium kalidii]
MQAVSGLLMTVMCWGSLMAQTATGFVYIDKNENGKRDRNEKGVPDVSVSNGIEVVKTDSRGKYKLPVGDDNILFVVKPSGYGVPVDDNMLPRFYYIHKPKGSPQEMKYPGVAPTGRLPKKVNFGLIPQKEPNKFRVLVFGDPQVYSQQDIDWFRKGILEEVKEVKHVSFGISLGDLVGDNLHLFDDYIKEMKTLGIPWYNMVGNHDLNFDTGTDKFSDESYEARFGPANYAFEYGKVHFIVLDDILVPDPRKGSGYWGGLRPDQLEFVKNDLAHTDPDKLIVLAYHIPMGGRGFREADRIELFRHLKDHPNVLMMSGHTHLQRQNFYDQEDGWLHEGKVHEYNAGTASGDWYSGELDDNNVPYATMRDGTEKGYAFLNLDGNTYTIDYKVAGKPEDYRMSVFAPKVVGYRRDTTFDVYVNFFMGAEDSKVEYRIGDGSWTIMKRIPSFDPLYYESYRRWDYIDELVPGRRPSGPVTSSHLWKGEITTELPIGASTLYIRATDLFGRVFTAEKSIRVAQPKPLPEVK